MKAKINYPEDGFTIDDDKLKKQADKLIDEYKYIENVPIGYSFYTGKITGILGVSYKKYPFINNVILQLLAYYVALKRGCDVDKPRNLAKSVTVE